MGKKKKLKTSDKVDIALSRDKSLREIASRYGVHHSSIDEILKESSDVLERYWQEKSERQGRPAKNREVDGGDAESARAEEELQKQLALKQMRIDWLELQLKWEAERAAEENRKRPKQLKKTKR